MKRNFKKMFLFCIIGIMLLSTIVPNVFAESIATSININGTNTSLVELFRVENGVTYLPIRLAFNDFEDQGFSVRVVPSIEKKNIAISVIKIDPVTGLIDPDRRGVYINWADDITSSDEYTYGRLELYQYEQDANGNNYLPTNNYRRPQALNNEIIFSYVDDNGGQRAYMSLEDLNNMVQFLIDDATYTVELK